MDFLPRVIHNSKILSHLVSPIDLIFISGSMILPLQTQWGVSPPIGVVILEHG